MTNQLITYRLPIDYTLISLMRLMSSISYAWFLLISFLAAKYVSSCDMRKNETPSLASIMAVDMKL